MGGGGGDVGCIEVGESDMRTVNYVCILHFFQPYKDLLNELKPSSCPHYIIIMHVKNAMRHCCKK